MNVRTNGNIETWVLELTIFFSQGTGVAEELNAAIVARFFLQLVLLPQFGSKAAGNAETTSYAEC